MRIRLAAACLSACVSLSAFAQSRTVDRALERQFSGQRREVLGQHPVNGVNVYDIRSVGDKGDTFAQITSDGDMLATRALTPVDRLPPATAEVLNAMARSPRGGGDAQRVERTFWQVDLDLGRQPVRAEFDATGRLYRIFTHRQMLEADSVETLERADRRGEDAVKDVVRRYFDNPHVRGIFRAADGDDFFVVKLTADRENRPVTAVLSPRGDVSTWQIEVDVHDTPRAVIDSIRDAFGPVEVERTMRSTIVYYRVERPVGGDRCAIDVRATGEIFRVEGESYRFDDYKYDHRPDDVRRDVPREVPRDRR